MSSSTLGNLHLFYPCTGIRKTKNCGPRFSFFLSSAVLQSLSQDALIMDHKKRTSSLSVKCSTTSSPKCVGLIFRWVCSSSSILKNSSKVMSFTHTRPPQFMLLTQSAEESSVSPLPDISSSKHRMQSLFNGLSGFFFFWSFFLIALGTNPAAY